MKRLTVYFQSNFGNRKYIPCALDILKNKKLSISNYFIFAMVEKRKKFEFVKTKSPSKKKKEYDHISKEASKTDSEGSSNFC